MMARAATCLLVAALAFQAADLSAGGPDTPRQMLERMTAAMSQMSYQGTFVYVQGEVVDTIRITHVADDKGVREHLVAISGPPREVIRDQSGVRWVLADDQSVFEDPAFNRSFFPEISPEPHDRTDVSYSMKRGENGRVAGHRVKNLQILPRDPYRYGYSLWLEEHSDLLLKWELVDHAGEVLARLMFTDVRLGSEVDASELNPASQLKKFKTVESALPAGRGEKKAGPKWRPGSLPPGFELAVHRSFNERSDGTYEHLVYSDGLAAVSVYIESNKSPEAHRQNLKKLGTTHAYSRRSGDMLITVVGDVPAITVKMIGNGVDIGSP